LFINILYGNAKVAGLTAGCLSKNAKSSKTCLLDRPPAGLLLEIHQKHFRSKQVREMSCSQG
jgi:hypothetical protein